MTHPAAATLDRITRDILGLETLATRHANSLDFMTWPCGRSATRCWPRMRPRRGRGRTVRNAAQPRE